MSGLSAALWSEALKARRSKAPWLSALAFSLAPFTGGLFMLIVKDPEFALRFGVASAKAQLSAVNADWPSYFAVLNQAMAVAGFMLFGLITIWVFGREYSDQTAKDLLALAAPREAVVAAKFVVVACWAAALAVLVVGLGLGVGSAIGLSGGSGALVRQAAGDLAAIATLTVMLAPPFAWVASAGRGYLPPIAFMFLLFFLSQVLAILGWGPYFPWSVPALASGAAGPDEQHLGAISYLLVVLVGVVGTAGTFAWWRWADQT